MPLCLACGARIAPALASVSFISRSLNALFMCGILGGVFRHSAVTPATTRAFEGAAATLTHRGPDDEGVAVIPECNAILGFRRLSIIDLASGHQPMSTDEGQHIIFNGEIYNYRDVRRGLEARGRRFRTASDTEVLLNSFAVDGVRGLAQLFGMWGFAFLDAPARRLWLARDRLGIKQLYYYQSDDAFFFASEPKALIALPWVRAEFDEEQLTDYLTFRCVPSPNTLFRGIKKLAPGTALEFDLRSWTARIDRYWTIPEATPSETLPVEEAVSKVEEGLLRSIDRRLVADVPVGALLSGGLDSSLVVAGMRRLGHREIRTFSAVFPGYRHDESGFSRRVAAAFGTAHHERPTRNEDFLDALPRWVELNDDLVADASSLPLLLVSQLARDSGCKVLLSGEGADELFAGYGSYHKYVFLRRGARLVPSRALRRRLVDLLVNRGVVRQQDLPRVAEYFVDAGEYMGTAAIWGARDIARLVGSSGGHPPRARGTALRALGAFDFVRRIPDDLLVRTDRATMGSSIEARVPFLDHELVELVQRVPNALRAIAGFSKIALRIVALRWGVPRQTVVHRKIGFQLPLAQWFRAELHSFSERMVRERLVPGLNYEMVSSLVTAHARGAGDFEEMLWRLTALELWYRRWIADATVNNLTCETAHRSDRRNISVMLPAY